MPIPRLFPLLSLTSCTYPCRFLSSQRGPVAETSPILSLADVQAQLQPTSTRRYSVVSLRLPVHTLVTVHFQIEPRSPVDEARVVFPRHGCRSLAGSTLPQQ